jgi:hypothetical protein
MEQKIGSEGRNVDGFVTRVVGIEFIRRWGWFVFLSMLLNTVCSYYIPDLASSTTYRATLQVQVHAVAGTSVRGKTTTTFFASLLQSPGVLDLALTRLRAYPQFKAYGLVDLQGGRVTATVIKNTNIIQLAGYAGNSNDAALIVSTVYNVLVQNIQKDRAQVIDAINIHLNAELAQVQAAMQQTETTLEQLKAIKQTDSSQYSLLANQYGAQRQRLLEINAGLATLKHEGYDNLLGVISPTPTVTMLPAAHATRNERLALSPLVGLIMGLGGVFVASRFCGSMSEEGRKRTSAFFHRAVTVPGRSLDLNNEWRRL